MTADKIRSYEEMLQIDPSSRVFELLAEELCALGRWEETARICRQGLLFHPGRVRPRVLLGLALLELGEVEESKRVLLDVAEEIRGNSVVFKRLAQLGSSAGDPPGAIEFTRIFEALDAWKPEHEGPSTVAARIHEMPATEAEPLTLEQFERLLATLAERVEAMTSEAAVAASALFSEADRDLLKQFILAESSPSTC